MRRFEKVVRGVVVLSVVTALSVPAEAARIRDGHTREKSINPVVKILKLIVRSLGDGLTDPKP